MTATSARAPRRHRRNLRRWSRWLLCLSAFAAAGCSSGGCSKQDAAPPVGASSVSSPAPAPSPSAERKRSSALMHLPANCLGVLRVNWTQLIKLPAVERQLRAAYEPSGATNAQLPSEQQAFLAFLRHAGIDPFEDVDELVVCGGEEGPTGGVMIIAGDFPSGLLPLMKQQAPRGNDFVLAERDGLRTLHMNGQYMVQASDNAVVLGQDLEQVMAAVTATSQAADYELPSDGEVVAVARGAALLRALAPGAGGPLNQALSGLERLQASLDCARDNLKAAATFATPEQARAAASQLENMRKELTEQAERAPVAVRLAMAQNLALARAVKLHTDGATLSADVQLPKGMIEGVLARAVAPQAAAEATGGAKRAVPGAAP